MDWSKYVAVNAATAHPHYDREGATYNMGNSFGKSGTLGCTTCNTHAHVPSSTSWVVFNSNNTPSSNINCMSIHLSDMSLQAASTTSSVFLPQATLRRRRARLTLVDLRYSVPFLPLTPESRPTTTALVSRGWLKLAVLTSTQASLGDAQQECFQ